MKFFKKAIEACTRLTNDVGKDFISSLIYLIITVGGTEGLDIDWYVTDLQLCSMLIPKHSCIATSTHKSQRTAIVAKATFEGNTQQTEYVVSVDVVLSSNKFKDGNFIFRVWQMW